MLSQVSPPAGVAGRRRARRALHSRGSSDFVSSPELERKPEQEALLQSPRQLRLVPHGKPKDARPFLAKPAPGIAAEQSPPQPQPHDLQAVVGAPEPEPEPEPELEPEPESEPESEPELEPEPAQEDLHAEEAKLLAELAKLNKLDSEPKPKQQPAMAMTKAEVRERVRAYLADRRDRREAGDDWIDARFDRFDNDKSGTVDESEWRNLLQSLEPHTATMTKPPPWGIDMRTNHNKALAVVGVQKQSIAAREGIEIGMVLTSVNGVRVLDAATGKKMAVEADVPARLGFDEPEQKKHLVPLQFREMVRIQLEILDRDSNVSDAWIDDVFDKFDDDASGFVDDDEWNSVVSYLASLPTHAPELAQPLASKVLPVTPERPVQSSDSSPGAAVSDQGSVDTLLSTEADADYSQDLVLSVEGQLYQNSLELGAVDRAGELVDLNKIERSFVRSQISPDLFERGPYECTLKLGQRAQLILSHSSDETTAIHFPAFVEVSGSVAVEYSGNDLGSCDSTSEAQWAHCFSAVAVGSSCFESVAGSDIVCITVVRGVHAGTDDVNLKGAQTPPVSRPNRLESQSIRQNMRAERLREGRHKRQTSGGRDPTSRWSVPVGALVAARATEATLHAAAVSGNPIGRPECPPQEVLVPAVRAPPSIACNIRRRSLGPSRSPPGRRLPVPTKLTATSESRHAMASLSSTTTTRTSTVETSASSECESEGSVSPSSVREVSPSHAASDGSAFVTRELATVKAAQLQLEGDKAASRGDVQAAREKYKVAAGLVEAASPLGVQLRRELDGEASNVRERHSPVAHNTTTTTTAIINNNTGSGTRRSPQRLTTTKAAPVSDRHKQGAVDGSVPHRTAVSSNAHISATSTTSQVQKTVVRDPNGASSDEAVTTGSPSAHPNSDADKVTLIASEAAATTCDAATAVVAARQDRIQALEAQESPDLSPADMPSQLWSSSTSSKLSTGHVSSPTNSADGMHASEQLLQIEQNLEEKIHSLSRRLTKIDPAPMASIADPSSECDPGLLALLRSFHLDSCAVSLRQLGMVQLQDLRGLDLSDKHTLGILNLKKLELKRLTRLLNSRVFSEL